MRRIFLFIIVICCLGATPDSLKLEKAVALLNKNWSDRLSKIGYLKLDLLNDIEKQIQAEIGIAEFKTLDRNRLNVAGDIVKIVAVEKVVSDKNRDYDRECLAFIMEFNLDNASILTATSDYIHLVNAYYTIKEAYMGIRNGGVGVGVVNYDKRIDELLQFKSVDPLVHEYLSVAKSVCERYSGYCNWMDNPLLKGIKDEKLKREIHDFKQKYGHLRIGHKAPDFSLMGSDKKHHTLSSYQGKVVVIHVWGTWCKGSILSMPKFTALKKRYEGRDDIVFMTIASEYGDTHDLWLKYIRELSLTEMVCLMADSFIQNGEGFVSDYNIMGAPKYFIIDKEGIFRSIYYPSPEDSQFIDIINKNLKK